MDIKDIEVSIPSDPEGRARRDLDISFEVNLACELQSDIERGMAEVLKKYEGLPYQDNIGGMSSDCHKVLVECLEEWVSKGEL